MPDPDAITTQNLIDLKRETFLREVISLKETDSTNSQALSLVASSEEMITPQLVYAESQSAGRGRGANHWWSQSGSLTFSLIVDMQELGLSPERQPQLSLMTGLAVLQAGQEAIPRGNFAIKWPNDVYLSNKKLAGILIEIPPGSPHLAVIGIGINVNNVFENASDDLKEIGASLHDLSGQIHSKIEILRSVLHHLDDTFHSFSRGDNPLQNWSDYCLLSGKDVSIQAGSQTIDGICRGINELGALRVETEAGIQNLLGGVVKSWE